MSADSHSSLIRVLIADDHSLVRRGLAAVIGTQPDMTVVAEAATGDEAIALFRSHQPDVALVDLRMPGMDGLQTLTAIRHEYPAARIIVLTTYEGSEDIHRAFQAGAHSYVVKSMDSSQVLDVIRAVNSGERPMTRAIADKLAERGAGSALTPRELEVLELMSKGLTNKDIGAVLHVTEGTVKLHVKSILAKLDVSDRTEAVTIAHGRGIIHLD